MSSLSFRRILTSQGKYDVLLGAVYKYRAKSTRVPYEFILPNDCKSMLTKGYESILWMVKRPALQAAGYEDLLCRQPDTYVHHGEFKYGTMGLIEFSFSAAAERKIIPSA